MDKNRAYLGEWQLREMIIKGDTMFDSKNQSVLKKWYTKNAANQDAEPETDTMKETVNAVISTMQEMFSSVTMGFKKDGIIYYNIGDKENKVGSYAIDKKGTMTIKWNDDGTTLTCWIKNDELYYKEQFKGEALLHFTRIKKAKN